MADAVFETERLDARPWVMDDFEAFQRIWGDPRVIFWRQEPEPREVTRQRFADLLARCAEMEPGLGWWAVRRKQDREIVGNVVLQPAPFTRGIEVGYHFAYDFWGQGYATEATRAALSRGFTQIGLDRIFAAILPGNVRSQKLAQKLGMERIGECMHVGKTHDLYRITREQADTHLHG
jgi:RimJ/RimL family protein N-acetyltransferase